MVITKTPFRVSFFGGGTDYPAWFREHGGAVLATSIDKYCYITCRKLPPFFEHKHRIVYSHIENVKLTSEIQHPAVRAALDWKGGAEGLEIHHDGDLPARSGLGSSSSFVVGLLHALAALDGKLALKEQLAVDAIELEQNIIGEHVGSQDQVSVAYGGLNQITFHEDDSFTVTPVTLSRQRKELLESHLMLFFTGVSRISSNIAKSTIENLSKRATELMRMHEMVTEGGALLQDENEPIERFGELLGEAWRYKRSLSKNVSSAYIDDLFQAAIKAGATGGKILGAGGGGFLMIFADPARQTAVRNALQGLTYVPLGLESDGSQIIFNKPDGV
jgi:D-glycero-alpha-D-manno-heptose-7-phosphate kinase